VPTFSIEYNRSSNYTTHNKDAFLKSSPCVTLESFSITREKLVRERGAGSGEQGAGISSPFFLEFPAPWRGRPITVDYKCVDFYKIVEVASITVVIKWAPKEGSKKGNLLPWMREDVNHH
jgi:hypothetical protein